MLNILNFSMKFYQMEYDNVLVFFLVMELLDNEMVEQHEIFHWNLFQHIVEFFHDYEQHKYQDDLNN